jgi:hypothetical protein
MSTPDRNSTDDFLLATGVEINLEIAQRGRDSLAVASPESFSMSPTTGIRNPG